MKLAGTVPASATPVESAWSLPGLLCIPLEIVRIARYTQQNGWLANSVWPDYTLDSCQQTHLEHCISSLLSNLQPEVQVPGIAVMISHTIEQSESPSWFSHRYTKMTASIAKEGLSYGLPSMNVASQPECDRDLCHFCEGKFGRLTVWSHVT